MSKSTFNRELLSFLDASPTPFHAVRTMRERLLAAGFEALDEAAAWQPRARGRYFVTRNDSSLIAFRLGRRPFAVGFVFRVDMKCKQGDQDAEERCQQCHERMTHSVFPDRGFHSDRPCFAAKAFGFRVAGHGAAQNALIPVTSRPTTS